MCTRIQAGLAKMKINLLQSCISRNSVIIFENTIITLYSTLVISYVLTMSSLGSPCETEMLINWGDEHQNGLENGEQVEAEWAGKF